MSMMPASRTLPRLIDELAQGHAERTALVGAGQRYRYGQLKSEVMRVARRLHFLGIGPQDKVGILMGNRPEWVISALAIASLGATMVSINTWATLRELEHVVGHSEASYIIASPTLLKADYGRMFRELGPWEERLPRLRGILGVGASLPDGWQPLFDGRADVDVSADGEIAAAFAAVEPDTVAFLLYTSGSTSAPKGVPLKHRHLIENNWQTGERQHIDSSDRLWLAISLFWSLGCANAMLNLLTHGGCIVLQEAFEPGEALRLIEEERCTVYYGTPNMAYALLQHPDFAERDVSSLRTGSAGGSPDQMRWVLKLGAKDICNIYGLTELYATTHITDAHDDVELRMRSIGKPLPGFLTKIVAPDGTVLPAGEIGELLIKGCFEGYYKDPELTARSLDPDGYFRTGDLVSADDAGNVYFQGRLKEMIKSGGINVSPAEIELVLMSHPGIAFAQVVGVPDPVQDEIVAAAIVLKAETALGADEVLAWCKARLAGYKVPRLVRFVTDRQLPLTSTGKIQKNRIAAELFSPAGSAS